MLWQIGLYTCEDIIQYGLNSNGLDPCLDGGTSMGLPSFWLHSTCPATCNICVPDEGATKQLLLDWMAGKCGEAGCIDTDNGATDSLPTRTPLSVLIVLILEPPMTAFQFVWDV